MRDPIVHLSKRRPIKPVSTVTSDAFLAHQVRLAQDPKMLRHTWLRNPKGTGDFGDRSITGPQQIKNPTSRGIGDRLKYVRIGFASNHEPYDT